MHSDTSQHSIYTLKAILLIIAIWLFATPTLADSSSNQVNETNVVNSHEAQVKLATDLINGGIQDISLRRVKIKQLNLREKAIWAVQSIVNPEASNIKRAYFVYSPEKLAKQNTSKTFKWTNDKEKPYPISITLIPKSSYKKLEVGELKEIELQTVTVGVTPNLNDSDLNTLLTSSFKSTVRFAKEKELYLVSDQRLSYVEDIGVLVGKY